MLFDLIKLKEDIKQFHELLVHPENYEEEFPRIAYYISDLLGRTDVRFRPEQLVRYVRKQDLLVLAIVDDTIHEKYCPSDIFSELEEIMVLTPKIHNSIIAVDNFLSGNNLCEIDGYVYEIENFFEKVTNVFKKCPHKEYLAFLISFILQVELEAVEVNRNIEKSLEYQMILSKYNVENPYALIEKFKLNSANIKYLPYVFDRIKLEEYLSLIHI